MNNLNNPLMETSVLSSLINDANCQSSREILDELTEKDFSSFANQYLFKFIRRMSEKNMEIDSITLAEKLNEVGKLEVIGGFEYVNGISSNYSNKHAVMGHAKILKSFRVRRELITLSEKLSSMVQDKVESDSIITEIEDDLKNISISNSGREAEHIKLACNDWFDELEKREKAGGGIAGLSTGFGALDEAIGGIGDESLVTVVGRPSHGKTLFSQAISQNVGVDQKKGVLFFSMEMSKHEIYERFISGVSNAPAKELRTARFSDETMGRIENGVSILQDSNIYQICEPTQSLGQIRSKSRKHKTKHSDLSLIVIDYLDFIELEEAARHDIAIGKITRGLKQLAKEIKVPIILICQASRNMDKATRPTMSDIKNSSSIEADSDLVVFVHRQEVAEPETELKGITEIIIAKDRHNGFNGTIYMEKKNGNYVELSPEEIGRLQALEDARKTPPKKSKGMY